MAKKSFTAAPEALVPYDALANQVRASHKAAGFPLDDNGIKRVLITLRALGLVQWAEAMPPVNIRPPDFVS